MTLPALHRSAGSYFQFSSIILAGLLLSAGFEFTQAQAQEPEDIIRVRTDLIAVPFSVKDAHGHLVAGLRSEDFNLADNGHATRIAYFAAGDERVALAFLLDNSGSLREQISRQRDAALSLFQHFGSTSSVAVIRFAFKSQIVVPFTRDANQVRPAFDSSPQVGGATAIFDAAEVAVNAFARQIDPRERRIVILISDGLDTASRRTASQVIDNANRSNVTFYIIQLPLFTPSNGRLTPRAATKGFRELAEKTGGKYFVAGNVKSALDPNAPVDLTGVFSAIEEDIRSQYVLGFYPAAEAQDNKHHKVAISLVGPQRKRFRIQQLRTEYDLTR
jgi:Ca-activated chloride channel homolog